MSSPSIRFENSAVLFEGIPNELELEALVLARGREKGVYKWALYIQRGPKKLMVIRDGLHSEQRFSHTGPKPPYRGILFLRPGEEMGPNERMLQAATNHEGTHNIAVRYASKLDIKRAIHLAVME